MKAAKPVLALSCAVAAVLFPAGVPWAFDEGDLKKLISAKECPGCDPTGARLSGADLRGADLQDAKITGANLTDADLTSATLYFADFTGAVIRGTRFGGARLTNALWPDGRLCAHRSLEDLQERRMMGHQGI